MCSHAARLGQGFTGGIENVDIVRLTGIVGVGMFLRTVYCCGYRYGTGFFYTQVNRATVIWQITSRSRGFGDIVSYLTVFYVVLN